MLVKSASKLKDILNFYVLKNSLSKGYSQTKNCGVDLYIM